MIFAIFTIKNLFYIFMKQLCFVFLDFILLIWQKKLDLFCEKERFREQGLGSNNRFNCMILFLVLIQWLAVMGNKPSSEVSAYWTDHEIKPNFRIAFAMIENTFSNMTVLLCFASELITTHRWNDNTCHTYVKNLANQVKKDWSCCDFLYIILLKLCTCFDVLVSTPVYMLFYIFWGSSLV